MSKMSVSLVTRW